MEQVTANKAFGGVQLRCKHKSPTLDCEMYFSLFLPPQAGLNGDKVPVIYWLSGLTCTDENFVIKAGAQRLAAQYGIAIVTPDTSPRGDGVPDDPEGGYDLGLGAGFYINATQAPWQRHYQMHDYTVRELPALINREFPVDASRTGISGHSMGGHGALTIALKNPESFVSVSAFSPICAPTQCSWGQKAFSNYLGGPPESWLAHDTVALVEQAKSRLPVLVDQGTADNFLADQLKTPLLVEACRRADYPMTIRMQDGYDHSYFFIATFIGDHLDFHARNMGLMARA
ncbi:MAG: S-formylglutathione hydrolase [Haliea sp.]|uniref:S-formylglutathione hydrolase n=1 Tax=Haliea sp. TaxID=1932666 RepID=UPI0032EB4982